MKSFLRKKAFPHVGQVFKAIYLIAFKRIERFPGPAQSTGIYGLTQRPLASKTLSASTKAGARQWHQLN
jgi:hypothetical protein